MRATDKILTIENDASLRQKIADYLEDGGFEVIQAQDGQEGLSLFEKEKPNLVLTNLNMPKLGGLQVLEKLSEIASDTPVVVVSEVEHLDDVAQALKRGAWDYVMKPLTDMIILERAIAKALERSRLVEENRRYRIALEAANRALKENLDILEEDEVAGRRVQMRMLPEQNVQFGDYVFTHHISPSLYLSGDFVDYFKINDEKFGFYVADVSGHGASSAFVTVLLKSLISLALTRYQLHNEPAILEPEKLLAKVSAEIYNAQLGKYLTIVYGVLDWVDHKFTYSIGGHYPNPIWLEQGKGHYLEGDGFPVGIMKNTQYQARTLTFPKNVELVMFSDGIMEIVKQPNLPQKEESLLSTVTNAGTTNEGIIDGLIKAFDLTENKKLPDDVTMLVLKRI